MKISRTVTAAALTVGILSATAAPALAGPSVGGVDVPSRFSVTRVAAETYNVAVTVKSPRPASTTTRLMLSRNGKTLVNTAVKGVALRKTLTGAKVGDYITITATDGRNVDREARRIVVGPM